MRVCVCAHAKTEWKMKMAAMQGLTVSVSGTLMAQIQTLTQRHSTDPGQNFLGRSEKAQSNPQIDH